MAERIPLYLDFANGNVIEFAEGDTLPATNVSGVTAFTSLSDTPSSYSGKEMYLVRVASGETELEFVDPVSILGAGFPVGAVYMNTDNVNPDYLFGGTWVSLGSNTIGSTTVYYFERTV